MTYRCPYGHASDLRTDRGENIQQTETELRDLNCSSALSDYLLNVSRPTIYILDDVISPSAPAAAGRAEDRLHLAGLRCLCNMMQNRS
ncbi:hypothetical protein EVAR_9027_1 [Eumeta japonica]|uniref:Uncharacterized protein n=1 Tax=Eumeta variegata TaxID=151549 RepID=A0A4C1TVW0_EUMVA|nr:hypothetical protein EVAR_9027_1 [Eumeta japonica]